MVADLSDREFAEMLAAVWERHGWDAEVTDQGGEFMVAAEMADGRRGAILVAPGDDGPVDQGQLQTIQTLQSEKGVDVPVAATRSSFDEGATEMAEGNGIHLVDPETLEETASAEGFEDLLKQYSGGSIVQKLGQALPLPGLSSLPKPSIGIPSIGLSSGNTGLSVALGVMVVIIGLLTVFTFGDSLGGLIAGLPIPDFGLIDAIGGLLGGLPIPDIGLGGGGYSVTAVSLVDGDTDPFRVGWNAKPKDEVVGPNGTAFDAPENHSFAVVQLNATNPTAETVVLEPEAFGFASGAERYGPQPLDGAEGQLPVTVPPGSSTEGYLVFTVPEHTDSGTLLALPGPNRTAISFERDRSLEFQIENA